jgi:hypothetical protein
MGTVTDRQCSRGPACTQYVALGKPAKLSKGNTNGICFACQEADREAGNSAMSVSPEHQQLLHVAHVLVKQDVQDENVIIPTLAFAALSLDHPTLAGIKGSFVEAQGEPQQWKNLELKFSNTFELFWPERCIDGVLLVRRHQFALFIDYHPDTSVVKRIQAYITDRSVKASDVAERYGKVLALNGVDHARSATGEIAWKAYRKATLTEEEALQAEEALVAGEDPEPEDAPEAQAIRIAVRPESPDIDAVSEMWVRLPHEQLPFPPPQLVKEVCGTLLGSSRKDRYGGYASLALPGRSGRGESPEGRTLIPACVAWYLADRGRSSDAERKRKLTRLLESEKILKVESDRKSPHEALWTNVRRRSRAIQDVERSIRASTGRNLGRDPRDKYF